jgi:hypothetical protein
MLSRLGDSANEAFAWVLQRCRLTAKAGCPGVEVLKRSSAGEDIVDGLIDAVDEAPP